MTNEDWFICSIPQPLSKEKTYELLKRKTKDDKDILITHNIRLVLFEVSTKFKNVDYDKKELVSIGIIGLINAVDTYDISKKVEFSTYAIKCIDNEILKFLRKLKKDQITDSLERTIYENNEGLEIKLKDILQSNSNLAKKLEEQEIYIMIKNLLEILPTKDKEILKLYFGFKNNKVYTQKEIADKFSISQAQVSRIIKKNLEKIRGYLITKEVLEVSKKIKRKT